MTNKLGGHHWACAVGHVWRRHVLPGNSKGSRLLAAGWREIAAVSVSLWLINGSVLWLIKLPPEECPVLSDNIFCLSAMLESNLFVHVNTVFHISSAKL